MANGAKTSAVIIRCFTERFPLLFKGDKHSDQIKLAINLSASLTETPLFT